MCKVAGVTKITEKNRDDVWLFMQMLGKLMSQYNNDGLGYAAIDKDGNIFGEKWLINDTAFQDLSKVPKVNARNIGMIYNMFGEVVNRDEAKAIILHTRMATCAKNIANTHPFVDDTDKPTVAIIHNGIIGNDDELKKVYSTCDSEVLAHGYAEHKVAADISNLNKFTDQLRGWYTVLNLAARPDGRLIMDAYTMNGRLGSFFIPELETRVWSTSSDDIRRVAKAFGMNATDGKEMKANTAMRLDAVTGELMVTSKINITSEPTRYLSGKVEIMEGNLDDERFRKQYFVEGWQNWPIGE